MPKRCYQIENHNPVYEAGYTKLARLHSTLSSGSHIVKDIVEFPIFPENQPALADEITTETVIFNENHPEEISLEELLLMEARIDQNGDEGENEGDTDSIENATQPTNDPNTKTSSTYCSITNHAMLDLIQCCNKAGTSMKFLDEFLRTLKGHVRKGFDVLKAPKRSTFMDKLAKELGAPHAEIVTSVDGYIVPRFNFLDQLLDLLSTDYFANVEHCCVNVEESMRFVGYITPDQEGPSEVMGSKWSQTTNKEKIQSCPVYTDPESGIVYHNWLLPIIIYNDKTGVGAMEGKYTLEPLMFTLAVLRREIREKADAWRHLGFIPKHNSSASSSPEDENDCRDDAEERLGLFHRLLSLLLDSLEECQRNPPLLHVKLFGKMVYIRPILDVAFVMGDQLSQDHHCGRKKVNNGGAGRAHRSCMCSFESAGELDKKCNPVDLNTIQNLIAVIHQGEDNTTRKSLCIVAHPVDEQLGPRHPARLNSTKRRNSFSSFLKLRAAVAKEILEKTYGLYPVNNAWFKISFGATCNNIYGAAVDDPFHYSEAGLFMYLIHVAFKGLLPAEAKKMERYLREDFSSRCSVRYDLPRGKFSPGFTNCTLLTGSEKVGLIFSLYLSLGTKRVCDIFHTSIQRQQTKYLDTECCYTLLGLTADDQRPPTSSLPKIWDQYYFSDLRLKKNAMKSGRNSDIYELPRNKRTVRNIVAHLEAFGLLFVVDPAKPPLDRLQTEYLIQTVWNRSARNSDFSFEDHPQHVCGLLKGTVLNETQKDKVVSLLSSKLKRGTAPLSYTHRNVATEPSSHIKQHTLPGNVKKSIPKHWIQKPKVKGRGDTSCILTDVTGFRRVLEYALVYHSIIHEYHRLDQKIQLDVTNLNDKVQDLMRVILSGIYRGDNSVDTNTCKIHAHFHLPQACQNFGCPMNFDAAKGKRGLKTWAIHASKTARKCGDATFVTQTAKRVTDNLLLSKAKRLAVSKEVGNSTQIVPEVTMKKWRFTRMSCHRVYNLETRERCQIADTSSTVVPGYKLIPEPIQDLLCTEHGRSGNIEIWREISITLDDRSTQYIRAFDCYDEYGSYFDWAQLSDEADPKKYLPVKVLLLYSFKGDSSALVWKASPASKTEREKETNISARWKMSFNEQDGLPDIERISITRLARCLHVFEHKKTTDWHFPITPVDLAEQSAYLIDETYERYCWALNFLDGSRW